jgi:hypothetical protein
VSEVRRGDHDLGGQHDLELVSAACAL